MVDRFLALALCLLVPELADAELALQAESAEQAIVDNLDPESFDRDELERLLSKADQALLRGWLVAPDGLSAIDLYRQVLDLDPTNAEALAGLESVFQATVEAALLLARELDFESAEDLLERIEPMESQGGAVQGARGRIQNLRAEYLDQAEVDVRAIIKAGDFYRAEEQITDLIAIGLSRERVRALRRELSYAKVYGRYRPGQTLRDPLDGDAARLGPAMIVIPAGQFMMGSPESERGRADHEGPRHRVIMPQGFALARTETTVAEFRAFIEATDYRTDAEREGWSRVYEVRTGRMSRRRGIHWRHDYLGRDADPDLPVIHVSWHDAQAYTQWLAGRTGLDYRLATEAEWEYALRGGTQSLYWWGNNTPDAAVENLTGEKDVSPNGSQWSVFFPGYGDDYWGPGPVASYSPNPFGLHDMGGNVMEWVEDCWHDSFVRAPSNGSAWVNPGCPERVIRGGSWSNTPDMSRSAYRLAGKEQDTDMRVGFRVARDL